MVRREATFPADPERMWRLVTEPDAVAGWFGARVEWELEPGSEARFGGGREGARQGRVEAVEPGRYLRFRWWPEDDPGAASEVVYELEPTDAGGTRLVVTEEPAPVQDAERPTLLARVPAPPATPRPTVPGTPQALLMAA